EPGAPFLKRWYEEYRRFRSKGGDQFWNEHSVRVPSALSKSYPGELTILPHTAFYWPLWTPEHLGMIYDEVPASNECGTLANHLWESAAWQRYLVNLTPGKVRRIDSSFHRWARPFLEHLPDEYGAPTLVDRWRRSMWTQVRRVGSLAMPFRL